jgi:hypothetical protein
MHCEWNGAFGTRIFERRFKESRWVLAFCAAINAHSLEGVSSCITRHDTLFDSWMLRYDKITICRVPLPPLPDWVEGHLRLTRTWQEERISIWERSGGATSLEYIVD